MARPVSNLRLFVAIYPPTDLAAAALEAIAPLDVPPHRPTPAAQIHLTLQFIGDTPAKNLEDVLESVRRSASGIQAFTLSPQRYITLPPRAARLVALETDAPPQILELHRRLALRLARAPRQDPTDRFLPHLTLARFQRGSPQGKPPRQLESPADLPAFTVQHVQVMRSILRPEGAEHREVERVELA